jgi:hypothetical protein
MSADMNGSARHLSELWDRMLAGEPIDESPADSQMVATFRALATIDSDSQIDDRLQSRIWANVIAGTGDLWRPAAAQSGAAKAAPALATVTSFLMRFAWVVVAGFVGGFGAGIGSRLVMRVAGVLTIDRNRFIETDNGNRVGELTLGGTLFLGLLAGAAGIVTLFIYLLLRNRLPVAGWQRSAVFGVLMLLVFGFVLMDPSNPDYHRFGPAWLNVTMFSSLYLLMGFCTSWIYEQGRALDLAGRALSTRPAIRLPLQLASGVVAALGLLVCTGVAILGVASAFVVVALGVLAWLGNRYLVAPGHLRRLSLPAVVQPLGLMVVPGIAGFILTARGVTEILMNR